jgi:ATP-binding cassette, subfamily B, bacterial
MPAKKLADLFSPKTRENLRRLTYLPWAVRLVWHSAAGWTLASLIVLVLQGLVPAGTVYLTKLVVDAVAGIIGAGATWEAFQPLLIPGSLMVALLLAQQSLATIGAYISQAQSEHVQDYIKTRIHDKAGSLDLGFFERTDYYDLLNQANGQASTRPLQLINNLGGLIRYSITLVSIAVLLIPYGAWLPAVLVLTTLPAFYIILRYNRIYHRWYQQRTPDRRQAEYFDLMLTLDTPAAEIRTFGLNTFFRDAYKAVRTQLRTENLALLRRQNIARMWASLLALVMTSGVLVWVLIAAMRGMYTLGDLALFYQAFNQGQGLLRNLLGSIGSIHSSLLFLEQLHTYLTTESRVLEPENPVVAPDDVNREIRFENITFRYPQSDRPALKDFSLALSAKKITAIVGANGAGKSTLIKLLCRFYDPDQGRVSIDGVDLRDLRTEDLRKLVTVLFQFPMHFQATAAMSIKMGDLAAARGRAEIEEAAKQALIYEKIAGLPQGFDTHLGKWFGYGTDLSGGEWQRLTLARTIYRQAPIIVLDEPTSAMDSWTENEWMSGFVDFVRGRTALIITHRFTTAMRADYIYVMDAGHLVEEGTHHQLLALGGMYASSWRTQMERHFSGEESAVSSPGLPPPGRGGDPATDSISYGS